MAMDLGAVNSGKKGRSQPEMNVTPLVDVVLVLLIVFMVLTAMMNEQFWVHVPEKDKQAEADQEPGAEAQAPIVVTVNKNGQIQINQDVFSDREFPDRLRRMLVARGELNVYFDAQDGVSYERAVQAMDLTRGSGAAHIAVVTERIQD